MTGHLGFIGNQLFRDSEKRHEDSLQQALAHPLLRVCLLKDGVWLTRGAESAPRVMFSHEEAVALNADFSEALLLGWSPNDGAPVVAARAQPPAGADAGEAGLRALGMAGLLDPDTEGQLGQAQHMLHWHRRSRFCGVCGGRTLNEAGGFRRRCPQCGELFFPRTDPVVIMLVHDGQGHCVLGRQPQFVPGMYSALAGFVEPGETLEAAVRREIMEESGLELAEVHYHASQPWPFPGSLMIGCLALASSRDIRFEQDELEDCRWFSRNEVRTMLDGTHPHGLTAPKPFAIAHHLVAAFLKL